MPVTIESLSPSEVYAKFNILDREENNLYCVVDAFDSFEEWCIGPFRYVLQLPSSTNFYVVVQRDLHLASDPMTFIRDVHLFNKTSVWWCDVEWDTFLQCLNHMSVVADIEVCRFGSIPSDITEGCWNEYLMWIQNSYEDIYVPDPAWEL